MTIDAQRVRKLIVDLMQEIDSTGTAGPLPPLTVDMPFPGEGIFAYAARTSAQTGFPANAVGSLQMSASATPFGDGSDPATWPRIIHYIAHPELYGVRSAADLNAELAKEDAKLYKGDIDPDTVDLWSWAYYWKKGWHATRQYELFSKKPIMRNKDTGALVQNPDMEFAPIDVSGYEAAGGLFAKFA